MFHDKSKQTTMKKFALLVALAAMVSTSAMAQRVKGSDTVLPLTQKLTEGFTKLRPSARVMVTGGGSGVGISALQSGTTDIAQASRRVKFSERQKIQEGGQTLREVTIAYDALAIVVHPDNKVGRLTREQLEGIFTGKITNWKQLGGEDLKIVPYARETSSGTYEFFREVVLKNKNYMSGIMSMPATGVIIQSVSQTKGAIGYVGLAYLSDKVKGIAVSFDGGKSFVQPSVDNAKKKTYPVVRPLYYYYKASAEREVKPFVDYALSLEGQKVVAEVGFIPLR